MLHLLLVIWQRALDWTVLVVWWIPLWDFHGHCTTEKP